MVAPEMFKFRYFASFQCLFVEAHWFMEVLHVTLWCGLKGADSFYHEFYLSKLSLTNVSCVILTHTNNTDFYSK